MNQETIDHYFSLLKDTLSTHALLDKPSQIYNVDESGVTLNPRPPKVVTTRGRVTKKQKGLAKQVPRLGLLLTNKLKKQKVTHPCAAQGQASSHHKKKARAQEDTIDVSRCCVCFTSYEDDVKERDWVMCACSRWLHEECADDCVLDNTGKERLCPLC